MEHYVTLFDSAFLPSGLCLHESLLRHASSFTLWIVCMDKDVELHLVKINLPNVRLIPLESAENERLTKVKSSRSKGEYCWTMTPFVPELVFMQAPDARRVTYLDADLFFYDKPNGLFEEFERSGKDVLITEHAFAPEYAHWEELSGKFCVQFLTFNNTDNAFEIMHWWQNACIDWCFARIEKDRFGDQKYLNKWPELFGEKIHILSQVNETLAPWNVSYYMSMHSKQPIFYHFHSLRLVGKKTVRLYEGYKICNYGFLLYAQYITTLKEKLQLLNTFQINVIYFPEPCTVLMLIRRLRDLILKKVKYAFLKY